jgi:SAM-dependent methyltransferase
MTLASERLAPGTWMPPWTLAEHEARYRFAAQFVHERVVVDCACGSGVGTARYLEHGPKHVFGFDNDPAAIASAAAANQGKPASFVECEGTHLPIGDSSCDVFITFETIEHIVNDTGFVAEISRVLRSAGLLICSTPNRRVTNPGTTITDKPWNRYHVREYEPAELRDLLAPYFTIEREYGQNPVRGSFLPALTTLGAHVHPALPVRINQAFKCVWFCGGSPRRHEVVPTVFGMHYEYLVWVCRPKRPG